MFYILKIVKINVCMPEILKKIFFSNACFKKYNSKIQILWVP